MRILVDSNETVPLIKAVKSAYEEGNRLNKIFSDWDAESEISRFSKTSLRMVIHFYYPKNFGMFLHSVKDSHKKSKGAFDITIGPASRLWRIARHQQRMPNIQKIESTLKRTGYQKLSLYESDHSAKLDVPGMVIDLGGVAKGYIGDRMLDIMKSHGFSRCLN